MRKNPRVIYQTLSDSLDSLKWNIIPIGPFGLLPVRRASPIGPVASVVENIDAVQMLIDALIDCFRRVGRD